MKSYQKVNGGDGEFIGKILEGVFSFDQLFKQAGQNILGLYGKLFADVYNGLSEHDQQKFIDLFNEGKSGKYDYKGGSSAFLKEFFRILDSIQIPE